MIKELKPYFDQEIRAIRKLGAEFAEHYPDVAERLSLTETECTDPHVERLIESFAFIAARIHRKLNADLPEITESLLGLLYPHYLNPVPSLTIAQFKLEEDATFSELQTIKKGTLLLSKRVGGELCRFRTCYPVELWPIRVVEARVESPERVALGGSRKDVMAVLSIRLECLGDASFDRLDLPRLRFFLHGESLVAHTLYELLLNNAQCVRVGLDNGRTTTELPATMIRPVGFARDEGILGYGDRSFPGYRILHEYFVFPEKFLFIDIDGLKPAIIAAKSPAEGSRPDFMLKQLTLTIPFRTFERTERLHVLKQQVNGGIFRLGCTPVVNLFKQSAEPVSVRHETTEYPVIPNIRRPDAYEIYSIDAVSYIPKNQQREDRVEFQPFYSHRHGTQDSGQPFWYARRETSGGKQSMATRVYLTLVDRNFDPAVPNIPSLSIQTTCTNGDLPKYLESWTLQVEDGCDVASVECLLKPTDTLRPPQSREALWRLISHLSLNHLSIVENGVDALREILTLYNFSDSLEINKIIRQGIAEIHSKPDIAPLGIPPRITYARGLDITITFDEDGIGSGGVYLFASILENFLALYSSVNSFVKVTARTKQRKEVLAQWVPKCGQAILL